MIRLSICLASHEVTLTTHLPSATGTDSHAWLRTDVAVTSAAVVVWMPRAYGAATFDHVRASQEGAGEDLRAEPVRRDWSRSGRGGQTQAEADGRPPSIFCKRLWSAVGLWRNHATRGRVPETRAARSKPPSHTQGTSSHAYQLLRIWSKVAEAIRRNPVTAKSPSPVVPLAAKRHRTARFSEGPPSATRRDTLASLSHSFRPVDERREKGRSEQVILRPRLLSSQEEEIQLECRSRLRSTDGTRGMYLFPSPDAQLKGERGSGVVCRCASWLRSAQLEGAKRRGYGVEPFACQV